MLHAMSPKRRGHGESALFRRGDGRWVAVVRVPGAGRRWLYAPKGRNTRAAALARLAEFRRSGRIPTRLTVGAYLDDWLEAIRSQVRSSTWVSYEGHVRMHLASVRSRRLEELGPVHVRKLRAELLASGLAPRTVGYSLTVLRMALRQAVRDELLERNVAEFVESPRVERTEPAVLTPDQARRFLVVARTDPDGALWTTLLGTGMRLGEALGLRWSDVDLDGGAITITGTLAYVDARLRSPGEPALERRDPKTAAGRRRIVPPRFVLDALRGLPRPGLYVFTTAAGSPMDPTRNTRRRFDAFLERAGLPAMTIHALRHTAASLLLAQGMDLEDVRRYLGHSSIGITSDVYGHFMEHRRREIAAALDEIAGGTG